MFRYSMYAIALAAAAGLAAGGCGDDEDSGAVPADAAVMVGNATIPKAAIDRQVRTFYRGSAKNGQILNAKQLAQVQSQLTEGRIESEWLRQELVAQQIHLKGDENQPKKVRLLALKRTGDPPDVQENEIRAYYELHKKEYVQPASRELRAVVTKTKAQAQQARRARLAQQDWAQVVERYSAPDAPRNVVHAGEAVVTRSALSGELRKVAFSAKQGVIQGPIKAAEGWWVFQVADIAAPKTQPFREMRIAIGHVLESQRLTKDVEKVETALRVKYRPKTTCADAYNAAGCGNEADET
jgi:hypothetical protein